MNHEDNSGPGPGSVTSGDACLSRSLTVKAETASLAEVRRFVEDVTSEAEVETEKAFDLKVAVSEACANAVEHTASPEEDLLIEVSLTRDRLTFDITDTGPFRPPSLPREAGESRGLGLPLMVALMDEVRFSRSSRGGTTVSLSVLLSGATVPC
jgi:serine/threonine-protein kinase RsbW